MQAYSNVDLFPLAEDGTRAESGSVAPDPKTGGKPWLAIKTVLMALLFGLSTMRLSLLAVQVRPSSLW